MCESASRATSPRSEIRRKVPPGDPGPVPVDRALDQRPMIARRSPHGALDRRQHRLDPRPELIAEHPHARHRRSITAGANSTSERRPRRRAPSVPATRSARSKLGVLLGPKTARDPHITQQRDPCRLMWDPRVRPVGRGGTSGGPYCEAARAVAARARARAPRLSGGAPQRSRGPWTVTTRSNARGWANAASSAAADACTQRRSRRKGRGRACRSSVARLLNRRLERLAAQDACEQPLAGDDVTRQLLDVPRIAARRQRPLLQSEGVDEPPQHVEGPG